MSATRPGVGPNRMRIRAFPPNIGEQFIMQSWELLERAMKEIQNKNNSGLSFEELYRNAYNMVLYKHGEKLYNGLRDVVSKHLKTKVRDSVGEATRPGGRFLEVLNDSWSDHTTAMIMIRDILMYMDRVYVQQTQISTVYNLGLEIYRDEVVSQNNVNEHLRNTLLDMIAAERRSEVIDWMRIKNACQMLMSLGIDKRHVYEANFENPFLSQSAEYYRVESQKFLSENSASVYVQKVEACLAEETDRANRYLGDGTREKILAVLDEVLITQHMETVVHMENSGVISMLANEKVDDLRRLYSLLKRVPDGLNAMTSAMSTHLRLLGSAIVDESGVLAKTPVEYIQALLDLKNRFDRFLCDAFSNDKLFKNKMQNDFEAFFNSNQRSPEFLSLFMDDKLRKGTKNLNEAELESMLDKAMVLFRFLQEKDVFERYYKQHLAKRFLLDKSVSDDAEKTMIGKLKTECGCQFTQKLENMFKDKELWNTVANNFKDHKDSLAADVVRLFFCIYIFQMYFWVRTCDPVDIAVRVLTAGTWPTQTPMQCQLPPTCQTSFKTFESYYLQKHNGRKITLNTLLGNAEIKAIFYGALNGSDDRSQQEDGASSSMAVVERKEEHKILQTNTHQMIVLLKFNQKDRYTFKELKDDTSIPDKELKRNLQSLAMGKPTQRILCRKGKGKEIEDTDEFTVNDSFTSKLTRIKIQMVTSKGESEPERKETVSKVDEDRKHEVEAAIVRIMKARKALLHNTLIAEVTQQLKHRFPPSPQLIKARIESLIEREYLARDDLDHRNYKYVS